MLPLLNERQRRLYLACEAQIIGSGGIVEVSRISGVSTRTIKKGLKELTDGVPVLKGGRSRSVTAEGKRSMKRRYPNILKELEQIIENDKQRAENVLHYTTQSADSIAAVMKEKGLGVSPAVIGRLLKEKGYNLRKSKDRAGMRGDSGVEKQFVYINEEVRSYLMQEEPVLVIEAKKFDQRRCGNHPVHYDYDYLKRELEKSGSGVWYRLFRHRGFLNAGLNDEMAGIAVDCLEKCFATEFFDRYRNAKRLLIIADFCETDGWVLKLRKLAEKIHADITVLHFPPGITRWDKAEHRFYTFTGGDERFIRAAVVMSLIGPGGDTGVTVEYYTEGGEDLQKTAENAAKDRGSTDDTFRREWNYTILPRTGPRLGKKTGGQYAE
jgi:hypothetical protein